jgi:hypothetical protein
MTQALLTALLVGCDIEPIDSSMIAVYELATLTEESAARLAGKRAMFRLCITHSELGNYVNFHGCKCPPQVLCAHMVCRKTGDWVDPGTIVVEGILFIERTPARFGDPAVTRYKIRDAVRQPTQP